MVNPSGPHLSGGWWAWGLDPHLGERAQLKEPLLQKCGPVCRANVGADGLSQLRSCLAAAVLPRPYCPSALGSAAPNPPASQPIQQ
ncbi:unnamed protein product [Boreogadus saida]